MPIRVEDGAHVQLVLKGLWDGKVTTNNVFNIQVSTATTTEGEDATLYDVADGFWQGVKAALLIVTSSVQVYTEIVAGLLDENALLVNSESYFIPAGTGAGGGTAESLPPADAWTYKLVRPSGAYRHGFKRFAGVPEEDNTKGLPTTSAVSSLNALGVILGLPFHFWRIVDDVETDIGGLNFLELVQRRINGDEIIPVNYYFPSAVVFDKIGHQDSRDIGRGV